MAVKIRLRRTGTTKRPRWRLVVADVKMPRDGRFIEILGHYNPQANPPEVAVKKDRLKYWLKNGAQMTETVESLFRKINILAKWEKMQAGESGEDIAISDTIRERTKKTKKTKKATATVEETETASEETEETNTEES